MHDPAVSTPATVHVRVTAAAVDPARLHELVAGARLHVVTTHPDVLVAVPLVVASHPLSAGVGLRRLNDDARGRRRWRRGRHVDAGVAGVCAPGATGRGQGGHAEANKQKHPYGVLGDSHHVLSSSIVAECATDATAAEPGRINKPRSLAASTLTPTTWRDHRACITQLHSGTCNIGSNHWVSSAVVLFATVR